MSDDQTLSARVVRLEELVAHQEHAYAQLNDEVLEMRAEFERLRSRLQGRIDQLEARVLEGESDLDPNEKPPHY